MNFFQGNLAPAYRCADGRARDRRCQRNWIYVLIAAAVIRSTTTSGFEASGV